MYIITKNDKLKKTLSTVFSEGAVFTGKETIFTLNTILCDYFTDIIDINIIKSTYREIDFAGAYSEFSDFYFENIHGYLNRRIKIYDMICEYERNNDILNTEGFYNFYLKDLYKIISEIAEEIKTEFLIKKEYDSFIYLMKTLIGCQTRIVDNLLIIADNKGRLSFYDDDMRNITKLCKNDFMEEYSTEYICNDEFLIYTILALAPEKITLIDGKKIVNKELLKILSDIYEKNIIFRSKNIDD